MDRQDSGAPFLERSMAEHLFEWTKARERPFTTGQALWWERLLIKTTAESPSRTPEELHELVNSGVDAFHASAEAEQSTALCLSGGGIRSAAFSLGVVQALAAKRLLTSFDYLSTVSGGGYLGGFLQRWVLGDASEGRDEIGIQTALAGCLSGEACPEIARLRDGATFLTPRTGAFSDDSWTAIATALRNLTVNWLLFVPMFMLLAAVPLTLYWLLTSAPASAAFYAGLAHVAFLTWAMTGVGLGMPTYRKTSYWPTQTVRRHIVLPLYGAALTSLVIFSVPALFDSADAWLVWRMWPAAAGAVIAPPLGLGVALAIGAGREENEISCFLGDVPLWTLCGALAGGAYLLASVGLLTLYDLTITEGGVVGLQYAVAFAPLLFIFGILAAGWLFSVLRSAGWRSPSLSADLDREWLVRLSAVLLKPFLLWAALAIVTIVLVYWDAAPAEGTPTGARLEAEGGASLSALGIASGALAALIGRSDATKWLGQARRFLSIERVALIGALIFLLVALYLSAVLVADLAFAVHQRIGPLTDLSDEWWMPLAHLTVAALLGLFVLGYGRVIDVNRFSLHGFYRNRLSRAFLGAARADHRAPDDFTGFDPVDNVRLHTLWPGVRKDGRRPALFPVVNVTLNAVATERLSWQERKALPFVLTPLACGSGWLGAAGAYVPASRYAGQERDQALAGTGATLAGAMAVSGAAASPNMGYFSSPATAFLMTLFNVRLGAWLPNPALWRPGPEGPIGGTGNAALLLLRELLGKTDDRSPDVYLSDGGHFENLGIYEMVRRRCAAIVAVDGACDGDFELSDLGKAVRKIAIDLGVRIEFGRFEIEADGKKPFAVATIHYPAVGTASAWKGKLLYIKACRIPDLPLDVLAYSRRNKAFPHEGTADQWFAESQFESYRALGQYLVSTMGPEDLSVDPNKIALKEGYPRLATWIGGLS